MDIKNMTKDELELLSYTDITYCLLQGKANAKTTAELFREIMIMLELPEKSFEDQIGDYYTSLTTDKRFIILDNGKWDLRTNHSSDKLKINDDDDDDDDEEIETEELDEDNGNGNDDFDLSDDDDVIDDNEDVLEDLAIVDEDYDEE